MNQLKDIEFRWKVSQVKKHGSVVWEERFLQCRKLIDTGTYSYFSEWETVEEEIEERYD